MRSQVKGRPDFGVFFRMEGQRCPVGAGHDADKGVKRAGRGGRGGTGCSPKVKPQFGRCVGDFAVYPASRNGGKRHHPGSEGVLGGGGAV